MENPDHPEHEEMAEWFGEEWDRKGPDMADLNRSLAAMSRIGK